jgi:hypothetical protein
MTIVNGQVTVTDSQGNDSVATFQFTIGESVGDQDTEGDRDVSGFQPDGFTVPAGQVWEVKGLVETPRNVVVEGTLRMRPGATLRFVNVNESAFVGGGMDPVVSDVGLWVMGDGVLDALGTPRAAWNRTGSDPSWLPADELVLTPSARGDFGGGGFAAYSGGAVPQAHPRVPPAEVLNLTRDVVIEGTPGGRSHIFIRSTRPQTIRHVLVRHVGPRKAGIKVVGRWPLHFHHMDDASRGSVVEGVVVRNAGSHAFVPHMSHGITFRECIAYDVQEDAYWWDPADSSLPKEAPPDSFTNGTLYERCVAALVKPGDHHPTGRLTGFNLTQGTIPFSNRAIGCVAVGVVQRGHPSGFHWAEFQQGEAWVVEDCIAHNNPAHGIFVWWNVSAGRNHSVKRFIGYRNGEAGISHGAYVGEWLYEDAVLVENVLAGVLQHAHSRSESERIRYVRPTVIGSPVAFKEGDVNSLFASSPPVQVVGETVSDCTEFVTESADASTTFEFL